MTWAEQRAATLLGGRRTHLLLGTALAAAAMGFKVAQEAEKEHVRIVSQDIIPDYDQPSYRSETEVAPYRPAAHVRAYRKLRKTKKKMRKQSRKK